MRPSHAAPLLAALLVTAPLAAQTVVPVHQEPHHRMVFESGAVRILDVRLEPGDTSQYHLHETAILYVPIDVAPTDAQVVGRDWLHVKPTDRSRFTGVAVASDTAYAEAPVAHRVTNVGTGLFHLVAITNSRARGTPPATGAGDAPQGSVAQESSWFTASTLTVAEAPDAPWRTARQSLVVVQSGEGAALVEQGGDGKTRRLGDAGDWAFIAAGTPFRLRGMGPAQTPLVLVEVH